MQARVIGHPADVRFAKPHVRFTPKSGHVQCTSSCPLSARSGHCSLFNHFVCASL